MGVNATHDWKRVKFRSNIQYMGTDRLEDSRTTIDNYLRKDKSITESTGHNRQGNDNLVANAFLEWKMDSVTTLIFALNTVQLPMIEVVTVFSKGGAMMCY